MVERDVTQRRHFFVSLVILVIGGFSDFGDEPDHRAIVRLGAPLARDQTLGPSLASNCLMRLMESKETGGVSLGR